MPAEDSPQAHPPLSALGLLQHMRNRQHVAPKRLISPGPNGDELNLILQAAATAPDHGRLHPWRFMQVPMQERERLGRAFERSLVDRDPNANAEERGRAHDKAFRSPCLLFAILKTAGDAPEVGLADRMLSLGCAIQNTQLLANALGYGCGITSGQAVDSPPVRALFGLTAQETGVCFLSFGTIASSKPPRQRPEPKDFFTHL